MRALTHWSAMSTATAARDRRAQDHRNGGSLGGVSVAIVESPVLRVPCS